MEKTARPGEAAQKTQPERKTQPEQPQKICVIGGGRWGQNHIRTLYEMGNLGGIADSDRGRLGELINKYPAMSFESIEDALEHGFDGYVVATPAETHFEVGRKIIESGNHVLIEKPMTLSVKDAQELVFLANSKKVSLMVGHILLFHPAIRKIKQQVSNGKIGELYYIYSNRLNFGTVRTEENVFWSFAPHDISVLGYIVGEQAVQIHATGGKYLQSNVEDFTMTQLVYPGNVRAHIFVSWLHPFKEQRLVVIGSKGMMSFDDSSKDKAIHFYNKRFDIYDEVPRKHEEPDEIVPYEPSPPLRNELEYFIGRLGGSIEIASGESGLEVVRVLENASEQLR